MLLKRSVGPALTAKSGHRLTSLKQRNKAEVSLHEDLKQRAKLERSLPKDFSFSVSASVVGGWILTGSGCEARYILDDWLAVKCTWKAVCCRWIQIWLHCCHAKHFLSTIITVITGQLHYCVCNNSLLTYCCGGNVGLSLAFVFR